MRNLKAFSVKPIPPGSAPQQAQHSTHNTAALASAGHQLELLLYGVSKCSLGLVLVAESARGICAILLGDNSDDLIAELGARFPNAGLKCGEDDFDAVVEQVSAFIDGRASHLNLPEDLRGTRFQQGVWETLRTIPPGETVSYAELAVRSGVPGGARAVAGACAANPLAVIIPCHRVVRKDGSLCGYRWGTERKQRLLDAEKRRI